MLRDENQQEDRPLFIRQVEDPAIDFDYVHPTLKGSCDSKRPI